MLTTRDLMTEDLIALRHDDSLLSAKRTMEEARIRHLPIAPLLGEAIKRIADESSVSSLFD